MLRFLFFMLLIFSYSLSGISQDKYLIYFTDKANTTFDPYAYFDTKAIQRKLNANISLCDSSDFPLNEFYVNTVSEIALETKGVSRWFNAAICLVTPDQIPIIQKLPFVDRLEKIYSNLQPASSDVEIEGDSFLEFSVTLNGQTQSLGHPAFKMNNYEGQGMRIAIFDVGFKSANMLDELEHVFENNHVVKTYDFVKKEPYSYKKGGSHGTMVMSCIAGMYKNKNMGLAPQAEFLLARTERLITEFGSEEENWLLAAEWADKNGADIINSSLGYTSQRYYQHDMQGSTALVTKAANFAASKGMLVINSAGNEGSSTWKTIGAPADADSVISVGGIEPNLGYHSNWSSYGPTADKRLKPNVSAYGTAAVAFRTGAKLNSGTSFSAPLIVGFAACAWQAHPEYTNMELFRELEKSGSLYPYFDYAHGYGLPQARYFLSDPDVQQVVTPTFSYSVEDNFLIIHLLDDGIFKDSLSDYLSEDSLTTPLKNSKFFNHILKNKHLTPEDVYSVPDYVYIHFENPQGVLDSYQVIEPQGTRGGKINIKPLHGKTLRIYYKHYIEEFYVE